MFSVFESVDSKLLERPGYASLLEVGEGVWINLVDPSDDELHDIRELIDAPADFFTDPLDADERARMESDDGAALVIIRAPCPPIAGRGDPNSPFDTMPIGVIIAGTRIVTICKAKNRILERFAEGRVKTFSTKRPGRFLIQLFHQVALAYLVYLKELSRRTREIEEDLRDSLKNKDLLKLLGVEKSLVYFQAAIRANDILMERVSNFPQFRLDEDERDLLEDALTESKQGIYMTKIYTEILNSTVEHFSSIIANNLNMVMKLLTTITVILMIPNLLTGFYGMNVPLPLQEDPLASHYILSAITGLSILSALGVYFFGRSKT
jgi:magnesium transporter